MFVMNELLEDIYEASSLMPRVAPRAEPVPSPDTRVSSVNPAENHAKDDPASNVAPHTGEDGFHMAGDDDEQLDTEHEEDLLRKRQKQILENQTYLGEMRKDSGLDELRMKVIDRTRIVMDDCLAYKDRYEQYSYLWTVLYRFNVGKPSRVYETVFASKGK